MLENPTSQTEPPKGTVPAVYRAVRLLNVLAKAAEPLSLNELTKRLGLPKSTVHGLCGTLVHSGMVTRYENGTYHLGVHVMDLAHAFLARSDLTSDFLKILEEMKPMPEETIVLSVLDKNEVVYLASRRGTRLFGFDFSMGMRLPANCAASGKIMLSTYPPQKIATLADEGAFAQLTENSITKSGPMLKHLAEARQKGYAIDDEETRHGMVCIGSAVFNNMSDIAVAAVGISMPKSVADKEITEKAIEVVKSIASSLSRRLGG